MPSITTHRITFLFYFNRPLAKSAQLKKVLFLNQKICCGYSNEPSRHQKHELNLMDKKIFTIIHSKIVFI